nr:exonuclease domain-containing protein [Novosphingobium panipatense]
MSGSPRPSPGSPQVIPPTPSVNSCLGPPWPEHSAYSDLETRVGVAVDVETTGLDHDSDRIIELAVQRFRFDTKGRIVEVGQPRVWREDPGCQSRVLAKY